MKDCSNPGKIHTKNQRKALKSYTCEVCGCEIPVGDYYWSYKPPPKNGRWFRWRKRCLDHEPYNYEEADIYEQNNEFQTSVRYARPKI